MAHRIRVTTPVALTRPPPSRSLDGDRQRLPLPNQHHQALAACHAGLDQVSLQHWIVLDGQRDDDGRVFRTLAARKLVFFYLWPQYHDGTPKQFQYIDASY
jgi:hypothetical protein